MPPQDAGARGAHAARGTISSNTAAGRNANGSGGEFKKMNYNDFLTALMKVRRGS
jgi:hypothetical protein